MRGVALRRRGDLLELQGESRDRPGAVRPRRGRRRRLVGLVGRYRRGRGVGRVGGLLRLDRGGGGRPAYPSGGRRRPVRVAPIASRGVLVVLVPRGGLPGRGGGRGRRRGLLLGIDLETTSPRRHYPLIHVPRLRKERRR